MGRTVRNHLARIWLLISISVVSVGVSAFVSLCSCKWHWFGRSGAIMTMAGVLLSVRPIVRMGFADWIRYQSIIDGGSFISTPEELEANRQRELDSRAVGIGAVIAVVGTLIWAYGDLIGGLP